MATNTPNLSLGSLSIFARIYDISMVAAIPANPAMTITPASLRPSWSRFPSRPVIQLQGTAIFNMYLLKNCFSDSPIQPILPIKYPTDMSSISTKEADNAFKKPAIYLLFISKLQYCAVTSFIQSLSDIIIHRLLLLNHRRHEFLEYSPSACLRQISARI